MIEQDTGFDLELSRRKLLSAAGIGGGAAVAASVIGTGAARAALASTDPVATPPVAGLHLQFGSDASSEIVVSWHTLQSARNPRVMLGNLDGKLERVVAAKETSYTDENPAKLSTPITRRSIDCGPTPLICTEHPTTVLSRSSARSGLPRVVERRSLSPASVIRARQPWVGGTSHLKA